MTPNCADVWTERRTVATRVRLLSPALRMVWTGHEKEARQVVEKHVSDPGRHAVSSRRLEVPVDNDDGDQDGDDVHDEGEEQVLGDEGDLDRRGW